MDIDDFLKEENVDKTTGEIRPGPGEVHYHADGRVFDYEDLSPGLNDVVIIHKRRVDGSLDIKYDYSYCPSLTEQHTAHLTDINYLMERYQPDEVAAFIAARSTRPEITDHDFSLEPSLQEAKNVVYNAKKIFQSLDENLQMQFRSPLEFVKFIDNPANAEKMVKLGLVKAKQVENLKANPPNDDKQKNDDKGQPSQSTKT